VIMNEITRIHLAKVSYDIEISAKKELENYFKALESFSADAEIISDIEIRMTEILTEHGVAKNGVISESDVTLLKKQLGEPQDFMAEVGSEPLVSATSKPVHKLYRDGDKAILGGVLSGIAAFFNINPLWVRLIFIASLFITGGTTGLIYVVLWLVLPPVRTIADKLQLRGQLVTVEAMRQIAEREGAIDQTRDARIGRLLTTVLGIGLSIATLGALLATAGGAIGLALRGRHIDSSTYLASHMYIGYWFAGLAVASGLLLSLLCGIAAYAALTRKLRKRIVISAIIVTVLGVVTSGSLAALGLYISHQNQNQIGRQTQQVELAVTGDLATATSLVVAQSYNISVHYYVTSDEPAHATFLRWSDGKTSQQAPQLVVKDGIATLTLSDHGMPLGYGYVQPQVTIYGPALAKLTGGNLDYNATAQAALTVDMQQSSDIKLSGQIETLTATMQSESMLETQYASIQSAAVTIGNDSQLTLGTVNELRLTTREVCAADNHTSIIVNSVVGGQMTLNDKTVAARSSQTTCTNITVKDN
jgi:phage shock protein PspC (stress-responsive transcriptional regulator)